MDEYEESVETSEEPEASLEPEAPEESSSEPEPSAPEPEEPEPEEPEAPEELPSEPEPERPEELPSELEPEAPEGEPIESGVISGDSVQDLIGAIDDLNQTISGAVTGEPEEEPPVEGEAVPVGGGGGDAAVVEETVDLAPVVKLLERTNELLVQQEDILVTQHNDLLQLQADVSFVFLAVAALIGVVIGCAVSRILHDLWRA